MLPSPPVVAASEESLPLSVLRFLRAYPSRFMAFYEPKVLALVAFAQDTAELIEVSEEASHAWDFTVALVTVVCMHHAIETARAAAVRRLERVSSTMPSTTLATDA